MLFILTAFMCACICVIRDYYIYIYYGETLYERDRAVYFVNAHKYCKKKCCC